MGKATIPGGQLVPIAAKEGGQNAGCYIDIPEAGIVYLNNLPEISDQKSAAYNDEAIMGRAFPLKTYSHSENRTISMQIKLFVVEDSDVTKNFNYMRWLESALYPRVDQNTGAPFIPPPVCKIRCGKLLGDNELCAVLKSYSVKFPTDVAWDENTFLPMRIDIDLSWDVVYRTSNLPGQERIVSLGN